MTSNSVSVSSTDRDVAEDERRFYRNLGASSSRGIRQQTLKRVISLSVILQYDYRTQGPAYQRWVSRKGEPDSETKADFVCALAPDDFDVLAESARGILPESDIAFLTEISDRTAWDYLRTLQYLSLSDAGLAHVEKLTHTTE